MEETIQQHTEDDPYVAQLQEVFNSCDVGGSGFLGEGELQGLCSKLHLENDSESLIGHLLQGDSQAKVCHVNELNTGPCMKWTRFHYD